VALDAVMVALLAAAVSLAGASGPSFWYDEAATISAADSRSLTQLWQLLGNIDAVHGLYYALMHGWFTIFPPTEFWSRVPSGLAVGVAAAGVVVLAMQFSPRSVALCAGVVFAILPRATWAGIEARPYALSTMAAVWLTVVLVRAACRDKTIMWLLYGAVLAVSILLNVCLVLMVLTHAGFILGFRRRQTTVSRFMITSVVALGAVAPFMALTRRQVTQIGWIPRTGQQTFGDVVIKQYFEGSVPFSMLAALVVATAVVLRRSRPRRPVDGTWELFILAIAWIAIPTGIILICSTAFTPIYTPRYLCFTAPAVALGLGIWIVAVAKTPLRTTGIVAAFVIAAAPNYLFAQRGQYAKWGMDYSQVADVINAKAAPGDCLLVDDSVTWDRSPIRALIAARPAAYRDLVDLGLLEHATSRNELFDTNLAPLVVEDQITQCGVLWIISQRDKTLPDHQQGPALPPGVHFGEADAYRVPHDLGFRLVERWQFNLAQVIKATR
jgi:mannosyltransferase